MEAFGIVLIVAGMTLVTTMFALLTNALVSRRLAQSLGHGRIPGMRGTSCSSAWARRHAGARRAARARAREVIVVERTESNRYVRRRAR